MTVFEASVLPLIILSFSTQETLEDIDKNGDGHVDEDEYIGKFMSECWPECDATAFRVQTAAVQSHSSSAVDYDLKLNWCRNKSLNCSMSLWSQVPQTVCPTAAIQQMATKTVYCFLIKFIFLEVIASLQAE